LSELNYNKFGKDRQSQMLNMFVVDLRQTVAIRNDNDIKAPDGWKIGSKFGTF